MDKPFLRASWLNVLMANFTVDKQKLQAYCPAHTELDEWNGNHYISLVGFLFHNTRVLGMAFPYHRHFEEVNLRFYVRHKHKGEWRRGVVFIKEIVPLPLITFIANTLYNEHYETRPMAHSFVSSPQGLQVEYSWQVGGERNYLSAITDGQKKLVKEGSEAEFITEHYWGYTRINDHKTSVYEVQHPKWQIHPVRSFTYHCSVKLLYGDAFTECLAQPPTSVFLADGSEITVMNNYTLQ